MALGSEAGFGTRILRYAALLLALALGTVALPDRSLGHSFWPTLYSSKTTISLDRDTLAVLVTVEVPAVSLVAKFRKHYRDLDLVEEIQQGRFAALEEEYRLHLLATLADELDLRIAGRPAAGAWRAVDTPVNGRANEGFFVYLLEFDFESPPKLAERVDIEVGNQVYEGENILFANYVEIKEGWRLAESSTEQPAAGADLTLGSPDEIAMWSEDPARRTFRVVLERLPQ